MKRIFTLILSIAALSATLGMHADIFSFLNVGAPRGPVKMPAATKIAQVEKIIENCYVDTVNTDKLAEEAIKAMLNTLDPHSSYSDPEET